MDFTKNKHECRRGAQESKQGLSQWLFFPAPRLRFWRSFGHATMSLSPSNLIGKPQACHTVPAAHIWTNTLREKDTNLSVRWQRNDERGREALARGKCTVQSPAPVSIFILVVQEQNPLSAYKWYQWVALGKRRSVQRHGTCQDVYTRSFLCCIALKSCGAEKC